MKSGFVAIVGRPNVGKSTLLNTILNFKVSIISKTPNTTRKQIKGIYNDDDCQIIFIDTPGIHKPQQKLGNSLNRAAYDALKDVDLILFLSPANELIGPGDRLIIDRISGHKNKIAIITKVDLKSDMEFINSKASKLKQNFDVVLGTSMNNPNLINELIKEIKTRLPNHDRFYDDDILTDESTRFVVQELIRESILENIYNELPHAIFVSIEEYEDNEKRLYVKANIYVERKSQKIILIGANGSLIKKIGTTARKKIMSTLNKNNVFLELLVKISKNWTNDENKIKKLGY